MYSKIYTFEPIKEMCQIIAKRLSDEDIVKINIFNNALWNKQEDIYFVDGGAGSHMDKEGSLKVEGISIDEIVREEVVTYIKLDVEGSELKALEGAKNTIIKNKPKLAICIYHKPEDIIEIPTYILELVPEYKFYIRHYSSNMWETVLYAEALGNH